MKILPTISINIFDTFSPACVLGYNFIYYQIDGGFYDDRSVQYTNVSD